MATTMIVQKNKYEVNIGSNVFCVSEVAGDIKRIYTKNPTLSGSYVVFDTNIAPFELTLKGRFIHYYGFFIPALYSMMSAKTEINIPLQDVVFNSARIVGIKFNDDIGKNIMECEITFLVSGGVTDGV